MKIVITSTGNNFEAGLDTRFGRCSYFAVYDTDTKVYDFIENDAARSEQGAGIAAAQNVIKLNPDVLLTGKLGPKAKQVIDSSTIATQFYDNGTIEKVVSEYMKSR